MFNISFGEIFFVAVVGLIIVGPQRLPEAARFIGHLLSRLQRQVASVKSDIRREMDLEDLKSIKREYEDAARGVQSSFSETAEQLRRAVPTEESVLPAPPAADEKPAVPPPTR